MNEALQYLLDRAEIEDVIVRYANSIDIGDWDRYRTCFTDEVETDFSEVSPGSSPDYEKRTAEEWVEVVRNGMSPYAATQHVNTNFTITVDGDVASCVNYIHAQLYAPAGRVEDSREIVGYYTWILVRTADGWRIRRVKEYARWLVGPWT